MDHSQAAKQALKGQRRQEVLAQCTEAQRAWERQPGRNLVLLFDGTSNILGNNRDTNVVKLLRLVRKTPRQVVYYDPGVGTANEYPQAGMLSHLRMRLRQVKGLAMGEGAFENIGQAYEFLCRSYQPGDRIWLFGFSRGAFTARAVGGMVNMFGLVQAAGLPLVQSLVRTYFAEHSPERDAFAADVVEHFALGCTPLLHFTGAWDTVETIGLGGITITNSSRIEHKRFVHIRHALAIHETRRKFRPREYTRPEFTPDEACQRSFQQRWFRGSHSDVGGSHREDGLSNIALNWMIAEARACGLDIAEGRHAEDPRLAMHDQVLDAPLWVLTGMNARDRRASGADLHESAQPLAGATPAQRRGSWLARHVGTLLLAAMLVVGWFTVQAGNAACTLPASAPAWLHWLPSQMQLLAPWAQSLGLQCSADGIRRAIGLDWFFIPLYWLWLAHPLAWSLRRWCRQGILSGKLLAAPLRLAPAGMWLLLAADVLENAWTLALPAHAWLVMLLCVVKLAALGWVAGAILSGLAVPASGTQHARLPADEGERAAAPLP